MSSYWENIRDEAASIRDEVPDPADLESRTALVRNFADGYVTHMDTVDEVLDATSNEPDGSVAQEYMGPNSDWRDMKRISAYVAVMQDLWDEIRAQDELYEEEHGPASRKRWEPFPP